MLLGLTSKRTLADVIAGECDLRDVLIQGPGGIRIVPAASGTQSMVQLSSLQHAGLIQAFSEMGDEIDVLIIDTAAGIGDSVVSFVRAAQEVLLVVTDEPTSITDAYALIKLLNRDYGISRFRVLANMAHAPQEGRNLFAKLTKVTERFSMWRCSTLAPCLRRGRAQGGTETACGLRGLSALKCALAFKAIAQKIDIRPLPATPRGHLEFFVERLISPASQSHE